MTVSFTHQNITNRTFIGMSTPSATISATVELYEPCTISDPKFILAYNSAILSCNYCYCPDFNRQYFIKNIEFAPGGQMIVTCKTDLINTLGIALLHMPVVITRATTKDAKPTHIKDTQLPLYIEKEVKAYDLKFDGGHVNPFNTSTGTSGDYYFVLNVAGGQAVSPST